MEVTLARPIAPGFYRECSVGTDEPVDRQVDSKYARSEVVEGDSTAPLIRDDSTDKLINFNVFGDGSIGSKKVNVTVDAHVNEGEVPLTLTITYEVAHKDATAFVGFTEGADKPIVTA